MARQKNRDFSLQNSGAGIDDREYYGRAFRVVKLVRYAVLVVLVLFTVFSMTFYKDEITFDNFRYLMKYIEISPPMVSGGEDNIHFSASSSAEFAMLGDKLAVVNSNNISSYDSGGRKILNENFSYQNPVCVSNGKYIMIYDLDGYSISVYNSFSKVFEKKLATPIDYAYLSDDGAFAVITREKSYSGGVVAFNSNFKQVFSFMTRTAAITDVCFDGARGLLACATTDVKDGDFFSEIFTFDITNDESYKSRTELSGELPLGMFCADKNFALMTDAGIHYYTYDGGSEGYTDFGYDTPSAVYRFDGFFAVTFKSALAGANTSLRGYDCFGDELFAFDYSFEIVHVNAAYGKMYVLEQSGLDIYNYDGEYNFDISAERAEGLNDAGRYRRVYSLENGEYMLVSSVGAVCISPYEDEAESDAGDAGAYESESVPAA